MPDPVNNTPPNIGASEKGTLFPSLDGSAPGDQPSSADITGLVLNELVPKDDISYASGSHLSSAPAVEGAAAPTGDAETHAAGDIEPPTERKKRTAADRISQLTRKYRQEQENNGALQGQLSELASIVQQQNQQIQALRSFPQPRLQADSPDPFAAPGEPAQQPARQASFSADDIAAVVSRTIEAHEQKRTQRNVELENLKASHDASFLEAAEEMPELLDARTRASQVFNKIYKESPLKPLPDAPYQIALQVRGILADEAKTPARSPAANQPIDARKRQASTITPKPATTDLGTPAARAVIQKAYAEVCKDLQNGDKTPDTFIKWRKLRAALQIGK